MSRRRKRSWYSLSVLAVLCVLSPVSCDDGPASDSDSDSDTDSDTDTIPTECSDEDPFDPAACPAIAAGGAMIRYVNADAAPGGDGASWATAYDRVQPAIDACACAALANGGTCEVWVAKGDYVIPLFCDSDTLRLRPGVALYGGFAGTETARDQRDYESNATVLDGAWHAEHLITGSDGAVLDGFEIRGAGTCGMINTAASPAVSHCTFKDNYAGMENNDSSPEVTGCSFEANSLGMINSGSEPWVADCSFVGNNYGMSNYASSPHVTGCTFAHHERAMMNVGSSPRVTGCTFYSNSSDFGAGMHSEGSSPRVSGCVFEENTASYSAGGAMYNEGGSALVVGTIFRGNLADIGEGGGMYNLGSSVTVVGCSFLANRAVGLNDGAGAGMYSVDSTVTVASSVFAANAADGCHDGDYRGDGGAMYNLRTAMKVAGCTFFGNEVARGVGGGIYNGPGGQLAIADSVFFGDAADQGGDEIWNQPADTDNETDSDDFPALAQIRYSDIEACGGGAAWDLGCGADFGGNLDVDPLFVNADTEAGALDLHLQAGSPCIDMGLASALPVDAEDVDTDGDEWETLPVDLDGNPRVVGDSVDMGAYEAQE
jgi:hypothetical protein